jgi:thioredoxin-related protein
MVIERTKNEVIIRLPSYIDTEGLQNLINYLTYKEATDKSQAKQADVDKLAKEVKKGWWSKNKRRLIK